MTNISSVVEFQRWLLAKNQHIPRIFKKSFDELPFVKSAKIVLSKSTFDVKNQSNLKEKRKKIYIYISKNINLGDHYLFKTFFSKLNF